MGVLFVVAKQSSYCIATIGETTATDIERNVVVDAV
jgi:hypothetical protein